MTKEKVEMPRGLLAKIQQVISNLPASVFNVPVASLASLHHDIMSCQIIQEEADAGIATEPEKAPEPISEPKKAK